MNAQDKVKGDEATFLFEGKIITGTVYRVNKKTLDMSWSDERGSYLRLIPYKNIVS